uniref:CSON010966 protein n=1 Tax=Culicoides sonorensis TaxID=179676 RepID=A0A336LM78_CULSO
MYRRLKFAILWLLFGWILICDTKPNPVPPDSSKDPLVEDHKDISKDACEPKAVFKVNCYNCWCNRIGTMAICKKARKCINPEAPVFIMYPEST